MGVLLMVALCGSILMNHLLPLALPTLATILFAFACPHPIARQQTVLLPTLRRVCAARLVVQLVPDCTVNWLPIPVPVAMLVCTLGG